MKPSLLIAIVGILLIPGCAQEARKAPREPAASRTASSLEVAREPAGATAVPESHFGLPSDPAVNAQGANGEFVQKKGDEAPAKQGPDHKGAPVERKIRYTAKVQIICDDFARAVEGLKAAVKAHKGLVAHSEVTESPGAPRAGVWRVRVPIPEFDAFREAVLLLGKVEKDGSDSEDLTEAYYDLENHIKNKLAEEEGLRKLLEKSGGEKMENILAIRRELAAVRDDINRQQGRLKLIANLTELTTVTVTLREKQKYEPAPPPDIAETPTFGMRISHTFTTSWDAFVAFVQFVVLAVTASLPWLMPTALVAAVVLLIARRYTRTPPVVTEVVQPMPPTPSS